MKPLSIIYLSPSTHLGGAERSLFEMISVLKKNSGGPSFSPCVVFPKESGPFIDLIQENKWESVCVEMPESMLKLSRSNIMGSIFSAFFGFPMWFRYFMKFLQTIQRRSPDIIHSNGFKMHLMTGLMSPFLKSRIIWHLRDRADFVSILSLGFLQFIARPVVLANSQYTAKSYHPFLRNVRVVYNGIPEISRSHGELPDDHIGMLSVLAPWKGHLSAIDAFAEIKAEFPNLKLLIFGDEIYDTNGSRGYRDQLLRRVSELKIENSVEFKGFEKSSGKALSQMTCLLHAPIAPEPFGRVVVEAQAAGVPVIASASGGILEICKDGENAVLFEAGNQRKMIEAIRRVLKDQALRKKLVESGKKNYSNRFSPDAMKFAISEVYDEMS